MAERGDTGRNEAGAGGADADTGGAAADAAGAAADVAVGESTDVDALLTELEALEASVDDPDAREQLDRTIRVARRLETGAFGRVVQGFDRYDAAEALVGSVVFGLPMLVEGGTLEVGAFVATHPLYLLGTLAAGVGLVVGLLYFTQIQDVRVVNPLLGVVPRRVAGVLGIAAATAAVAMTAWGRVDWADPWVATCQVSVCFVAMALGGALGDILPGT